MKYGTFKYGIYKPKHNEDLFNIFNSIRWHIENAQFYNYDDELVTFVEKYPNVTIGIGYPENMSDLTLPHLAIDYSGALQREYVHYTRSREPHDFTIWGFCGGLEGGESNHKQRVNMMHDLKSIFDNEKPGNDWIYLFDFNEGVSGSRPTLDTLQIVDVNSDLIHGGSSETLEASRFRFKVTVTLGLYK